MNIFSEDAVLLSFGTIWGQVSEQRNKYKSVYSRNMLALEYNYLHLSKLLRTPPACGGSVPAAYYILVKF